MRALNEIGYDGALSVDWHDPGMDREYGAADACRFVKAVDFDPPARGPKPPSAEARRQLIDLPIDFATGERLGRGSGGGFVEHFRVDRQGQLEDTQYRLVSRPDVFANRDWDNPRPRTYEDDIGPGFRFPSPWRVMPRPLPPAWGGFFGQPYRWGDEERPRPRRVDPDYPWRNRGLY